LIARYWKSAESFREVSLEELDRLEQNAKDTIASGGSIETHTKTGPKPVRGVEIRSEIRTSALEEALERIAERKQLVQVHYVEMHHAATTAFPTLLEVIGVKESSLATEGFTDDPAPK
jgi:hypothetical protein